MKKFERWIIKCGTQKVFILLQFRGDGALDVILRWLSTVLHNTYNTARDVFTETATRILKSQINDPFLAFTKSSMIYNYAGHTSRDFVVHVCTHIPAGFRLKKTRKAPIAITKHLSELGQSIDLTEAFRITSQPTTKRGLNCFGAVAIRRPSSSLYGQTLLVVYLQLPWCLTAT